MPAQSRLRAPAAITGNIDGVSAGTVTRVATQLMRKVAVGTLSADITLDAETNTLTMTPVWEVSTDGNTYTRLVQPNGAAEVAMATGTGGADASVSRVVSAPSGAYGYRYVALSILSGVVAGNAVDTYSVAMRYVSE